MLICNVEANYQFATLQSCFIIRSRLNFFCVLVPASDVWLLYNRGCFASVFFITSCAGDIELSDSPRTGPHLTLAHVRAAPRSPSASTASSPAAIPPVSPRKRGTEMTKDDGGKELEWTSVVTLSCSKKGRRALHFKRVFVEIQKGQRSVNLGKNKSKQTLKLCTAHMENDCQVIRGH